MIDTTEIKIADLVEKIRTEIKTGKLDSLKAISEMCKALAYKNDFDFGSYSQLAFFACGAYIIHCEVENIVPKSGY